MGGTTWLDKAAIRISVSNWSTTEADIDRTAAALLRAAAPLALRIGPAIRDVALAQHGLQY